MQKYWHTAESLGQLFARARAEQGLSLRALEAKTEFSRSMLSRFENGQAEITWTQIVNLCEALGITQQDLLRE